MGRQAGDAPLSDAEWKVMHAVWARGGEVSARDVLDVVVRQTGWAYTTLKTLMDRLVEKGVLAVEVRRNVSFYRARLRKDRAVATAADDLTRRAFGGEVAPLVHHLLGSRRLSTRDRAELRRLLDEADAGTKGRKR